MDYRRKSPLQLLDGLVGWTGAGRRIGKEPRMRRLKWIPAVILAWATASLVLSFVLPDRAIFGSLTISMAGVISACLVQMGPMRPKPPEESSDEREQLWRARTYLFTFGAIGLVAFLGIATLGGYALWLGVTGRIVQSSLSPLELFGYWAFALGQYLVVMFGTLPTLHASWTMPEIIEDEPEPEETLRFVKSRRR